MTKSKQRSFTLLTGRQSIGAPGLGRKDRKWSMNVASEVLGIVAEASKPEPAIFAEEDVSHLAFVSSRKWIRSRSINLLALTMSSDVHRDTNLVSCRWPVWHLHDQKCLSKMRNQVAAGRLHGAC